MRLLASILAFAVFAASCAGVAPTWPVASHTAAAQDDGDGASLTATRADGDDPALREPVEGGDRDEESETEAQDSSDDADLELIAVLPPELALTIALGRAQAWARTHARPNEDPDRSDPRRPPITT